MSVKTKQIIIAVLGGAFLVSLIIAQAMEVARRAHEAGADGFAPAVQADSKACVDCHLQETKGIVDHWMGSTHAEKGVGCVNCHGADAEDADAYDHKGTTIATIVTPRDCGECHKEEYNQFTHSHHAMAGNILASLDNFLAETVEGAREPFNPHSPTPGHDISLVNGMASVNVGCKQCHGAKIALEGSDGSLITFEELGADPKTGRPTNLDVVEKIKKNDEGQPVLSAQSWPNTGIGRLNLDGSRGSCSACHSRHDFSPRRARQPENCGKCHLGPDHPQKEIFEESKHGIAYRDLKERLNLDAEKWVLGKDYSHAPTCATCHMSGNTRNDGTVTHDPGERISWTNRPPVSAVMDTDENGKVVKEADPQLRKDLVVEGWEVKRKRMVNVCAHCHTENYVNKFYTQYDDFVVNYNEKFAKPGVKIMGALKEHGLITKTPFDDEIEWTWFYLWHHEGRRARHGASMFAPDYAHWHGMYEVAERFYVEMIPQARELAEEGRHAGNAEGADAVEALIQQILARPEHAWFEKMKHAAELAAAAGGASGDAPAEGATAPAEPDAPEATDAPGEGTPPSEPTAPPAESGTTEAPPE